MAVSRVWVRFYNDTGEDLQLYYGERCGLLRDPPRTNASCVLRWRLVAKLVVGRPKLLTTIEPGDCGGCHTFSNEIFHLRPPNTQPQLQSCVPRPLPPDVPCIDRAAAILLARASKRREIKEARSARRYCKLTTSTRQWFTVSLAPEDEEAEAQGSTSPDADAQSRSDSEGDDTGAGDRQQRGLKGEREEQGEAAPTTPCALRPAPRAAPYNWQSLTRALTFMHDWQATLQRLRWSS